MGRLDMENEILWKNFLDILHNKISSVSYDTWFKDTKLLKKVGNKLTIEVPMTFHKKFLNETYYDLIEEIISSITGQKYELEFVVEDDITPIKEFILNENVTNKDENINSNLNPKYTFENFVIGESNRFAQTAALAVAEQPGKIYNPLFIYGKSGLGKTHLMHAIGNYTLKKNKNRVLYVTCEKFVEDFVGINKRNEDGNNYDAVDIFKRKYRDIDVLIIDDIQFLGNRVKTQQEFFNTFNELYDKNKQIIISSDSSPDDLKLLEERLTTRFNWGITIPIEQPDFDLRMKIIDNKLDGHILKDEFSQDVKEFIASNCTSDIRKLEGAITRVTAYATMMGGSKITLDLASEALKDYFVKSIVSKNKIDKIQQIVATNYNISVDDL